MTTTTKTRPARPGSKRAKLEAERAEAREYLRAILPPGSTVYTIHRHRPASNLWGVMSVIAIVDGRPRDISWRVAQATTHRWDEKYSGVRVHGCGLDRGHHLTMALSYVLHGRESVGPDAIEAAKRGAPFSPRPDAYRAGYSLRHEWF